MCMCVYLRNDEYFYARIIRRDKKNSGPHFIRISENYPEDDPTSTSMGVFLYTAVYATHIGLSVIMRDNYARRLVR